MKAELAIQPRGGEVTLHSGAIPRIRPQIPQVRARVTRRGILQTLAPCPRPGPGRLNTGKRALDAISTRGLVSMALLGRGMSRTLAVGGDLVSVRGPLVGIRNRPITIRRRLIALRTRLITLRTRLIGVRHRLIEIGDRLLVSDLLGLRVEQRELFIDSAAPRR